MGAKKSNKIIWYLVGLVVVLIIVVIVGKKAGWIGGSSSVKVSVTKAEKKNITESVSANGKIQPVVEVKISPDVSGEIKELTVKEGDSVEAGSLLARIDPELYQSALDRAEASLNNSKANLANSRARIVQSEAKMTEVNAQFERNKKLYAQKLISDAEMETSQSMYAAAKADLEASKQTVIAGDYTVKSLEASVREAKKNLVRTEIFAPVSGIVSKLNVKKGERVVGTSQMAGTEMMRIADLNDMEVDVDVNENDIVKVALRDTANIDVDAYTNRKFKGVVFEMANSANITATTTSDQVTNFVVKIRILRTSYVDLITDKKKDVFRPGMSASVDIQTKRVTDAIAVPIESVTIRSKSELDSLTRKNNKTVISKTTDLKKDDEVEVVFVLSGDTIGIKKVVTGIQDDKLIQVISGIQEGEEVVTGPYSAISKTLHRGDKVRKVSKEELFDIKPENKK